MDWCRGSDMFVKNVKKEEESVRMEQRFNTITRNYSRKEGPEMFSLTLSRQVEVESTFQRQRVENLIVLFDVEMQILIEMMNIGFVTKDFYGGRMTVFVKMFKGFVGLLEKEMESGKLTRHQVFLNDVTIDEVYARVGQYFEADRREVEVKFIDHVESPTVVIEMPVEISEEKEVEVIEPIKEEPIKEEPIKAEPVVEEPVVEDMIKVEASNEFKEESKVADKELGKELDAKLKDLDLDGFDL